MEGVFWGEVARGAGAVLVGLALGLASRCKCGGGGGSRKFVGKRLSYRSLHSMYRQRDNIHDNVVKFPGGGRG